MTRTLSVALALAIAASAASAQSTPNPSPPHAAAPDALDTLTAQERDALAAAEQLAADAAQRLDRWIATQAISEDRLFARLYFPIANTDPQRYATPYEALADRDLVASEDATLGRSNAYQYAIVTDANAYVPAHNSKFAQPLSGNREQDYLQNRSKRLLGDLPSLLAARSEARYLLQRTRLETGEVVYDVSVPVTVRGKHWGCARVGFRRAE
jgi:methyl-accepting chemotaxis protein